VASPQAAAAVLMTRILGLPVMTMSWVEATCGVIMETCCQRLLTVFRSSCHHR